MTTKPPPIDGECELHFMPNAADSHRTPLFGGGGKMPLPIALSLRRYFTLRDDNTMVSVPLAEIENQFKLLVTGTLTRTGFAMPPHLDWDTIYSPALQALACEVAQGAFLHMNEVQSPPPLAEIMVKAERLGKAIGLKLDEPEPVIFTPATPEQAVAPTPKTPEKA